MVRGYIKTAEGILNPTDWYRDRSIMDRDNKYISLYNIEEENILSIAIHWLTSQCSRPKNGC